MRPPENDFGSRNSKWSSAKSMRGRIKIRLHPNHALAFVTLASNGAVSNQNRMLDGGNGLHHSGNP